MKRNSNRNCEFDAIQCIQLVPIDDQESSVTFGKFLEDQATVNELQLNYVPSYILKIILSKLKALKVFRINSTSLPVDKEFYDQFLTISSLKELTLHDAIPSEEAVRSLPRLFPNLEVLKAIHDPQALMSRVLPFISMKNTHLETLQIETLKLDERDEVVMKSLKFLHLEKITDLDSLSLFFRSNPLVETLSFNCYDDSSNNEMIAKLLAFPNLKHLKISASIEGSKTIIDVVKKHCKTLKSLELIVRGDKATKSLLYHLPENVTLWEPRSDVLDAIEL